jgi:hypothetical protein
MALRLAEYVLLLLFAVRIIIIASLGTAVCITLGKGAKKMYAKRLRLGARQMYIERGKLACCRNCKHCKFFLGHCYCYLKRIEVSCFNCCLKFGFRVKQGNR